VVPVSRVVLVPGLLDYVPKMIKNADQQGGTS
jgi:hypothetical protein